MENKMTQEQKINRGTIIIFILSIVLVACLCATATLAYFAGNQKSNVTLIMGGPVRVTMVNGKYEKTYGDGNLVMNIKCGRDNLLPGIGVDMQAIAKLTSSDINSTPALLRAILDITVTGISTDRAKRVETMIRNDLGNALTSRIDISSEYHRDGWVQFDDGYYYYCSEKPKIDKKTQTEYVELKSVSTNAVGNNIPFINGTFQFPRREYTNEYANIEITFNLTFQAIQNKILNEDGEEIPNTIQNVKQVLDGLDWNKHND